jgi:plastocyanin
VILASLLLVLGAVSTAIITSGEEEEAGEAVAATSTELDLAADPDGAASFDKTEGTVKAGTVTVKLVNESPLEHNVAVAQGSRELGRSDTITASETELEVDLRPGEYAYYCTVDGHREAGMEGTLTVR